MWGCVGSSLQGYFTGCTERIFTIAHMDGEIAAPIITMIVVLLQGFSYGPLASLKGSELRAPVLQVVCNGVIIAEKGFRIRAYSGTIGSTLELLQGARSFTAASI